MTFWVGQKVVCIARVVDVRAIPHPDLRIGKIYTVTSVMHEPHWRTAGLLLAEIAPRSNCVAFESLMFRPIVERKTDISFAHEILRKASRKDQVGA